MKIISWDVGIIHLAYCIMEKSDDPKVPFKIYEWENINILEQEEKPCYGFINGNDCNNRNKCCKPIKFSGQVNNKLYHFCGLHKSQYNKILNTKEEIKFKKDDCKNTCCFELKTKKKICNKNTNWFFTKNDKKVFYCNSHKNQYLKNQEKLSKLTKIKRKNACTESIDVLKYKLMTILDKKKHMLKVDKVLIENQPSLKNPKMKSIANTLYCWFLMRGIIDKEQNNSLINQIKFISPSNKLKVNNDNTVLLLSKSSNDTEKYKLTKRLGIQYCNQLIINDNNNYDFLQKQKKKDDLCDAFLQGVYYLSILKK